MSSNLKKGATIAKIAFLIVLAVGIVETIVAGFSGSVALLADGIHSISTAMIFLIVWIGLHLSGRSPDNTFHFGYYRIETLGSLIAAFVLTALGVFILYESYASWIEQREIVGAIAAIVTASIAAATVVPVSLQIDNAAKKYRSTALRTGGLSGLIDVFSSMAVVIGVALSNYFGIFQADSIASILIAGAIFVGGYSIFKEASLVLVDACQCGDIVTSIGDLVRSVKGIQEVHSIRMRKLGSYIVGDLHIVVDDNMLVKEADEIATEVEQKIKKEFGEIMEIKVRIESNRAHDTHAEEFVVRKNGSNLK